MQSLSDLLSDTDDKRNVGLIVPSAREYFCSFEMGCPLFDVSVEDNDVAISFEMSEELSAMTSFSESYHVPRLYSKLRSFKHDFTFSCLSSETDMALGKAFPSLFEPDSLLTPDVIVINEKTVYVIEFTTRHAANVDSIKIAFQEKVHKYQPILMDQSIYGPRCARVVYFVIAVGLQHVYTNLTLTEETVRELVVRYNISCVVNSRLIETGYITQDTQILTDQEGRLLDWFNSISKKGPQLDNEFSYENYLRTLQPANPEEVNKIIACCLQDAIHEVLNHRQLKISGKIDDEEAKAWNAYESQMKSENPDGFSTHRKVICNMPWINCRIVERSTEIPDWRFAGLIVDSTSETWIKALEQVSVLRSESLWQDQMVYSTIEEQSFENLQDSVAKAVELQKMRQMEKTVRNKVNFQRVKLQLSHEAEMDLAKVGVCGKRHSHHQEVIRYRNEKHLPFGLDTDFSDIEEFMILPKQSYFSPEKELCTTMDFILSLIKTSDGLHGGQALSDKFQSSLKSFIKTPYFQWCKMISDIGNEVAVSMKQHCKSKEYVLKKLQDWPLYIILKPTKSSSHCFFSLMVWNTDLIKDQEVPDGIFRHWETNGIISWTEFISLNASKISNWVLMESRAVDLYYYWLDFYKVEPFTEHNVVDLNSEVMHEVYNMVWITTLIAIVDKAEVEETCSISRFISMEGFVSHPLIAKPYKMYEKFPIHIRSRLTIFLISKLHTFSKLVTKGLIKMVVEDNIDQPGETITLTDQYVKWDGLQNWITGFLIETPGQLVNLMYLGYIKNKNETPESNSETKLIEKILTLEDKLTPEIQSRIGVVNKKYGSGTFHEWNIDLLKWCCQKSKEHLFRKGTIRSNSDLGDQFISRLARISVEEVLMTLKASSNFDEDWFEYKPGTREATSKEDQQAENTDKNRPYFRTKVIEKALKLAVDDKTMLMDILPQCLEECVNRNFMRVCIFKKQQHGGLREIYVLNIAERVVQFTIELMGRMICELFPGETMTHPESKASLPKDHQRRVHHRFGKHGRTVTTNTSADSAKWSQNQYCFKLATVLLLFFPAKLHGFILNATQLWRHKFIKIGDSLLHLFSTKSVLKFWNPLHKRMYDAYNGHLEVSWMSKGQSYVRVRSGMMQGILHYVSSAFHTIVNHGLAVALTTIIQSKNPGIRIEYTNMQSSDDSGLILTINGPERYSKPTLLTFLSVGHIFKALFSEELAIKNSIKTTFHTSRVYEFNSRFYFSSQLFEPEIKLLFASVLISQQENLLDRQDELYTLISSFVSVGGSFCLAKFAQYGQALLYYRCLGLTVCPEFGLLKNVLRYVKDPSLGFFLTDHPYMCGLSGMSYNLWNCATTSNLGGVYRVQLEKLMAQKIAGGRDDDVFSTISSGQLLRQVHVGWGSTMKLKAMKRRMGIEDGWQEMFNTNPEALFRDAKTTSELKAKAALKLNQRGVASSLSTGVPITSIIATSVYILRDFVFSIGELKIEDESVLTEYHGDNSMKVSIFQLLIKALIEESEGLSEDQELLLFPNSYGFHDLRRKVDSLNDAQLVKKMVERRRVVTKLVVYDRETTAPISTLTLLKLIWFPDLLGKPNVRFSRRLLEPLFTNLQAQVKWLSHSPIESLRDSPFEHMHQMVNWFRSFDEKDRVMCLLGAPLLSRKGRSTLMSALVNNFHCSFKLHFSSEQIEYERLSSSQIIQSILLISLFPYTIVRKTEMITNLIHDLPSNFRFNPTCVRSRANMLCIMREAMSDQPSLSYIYDCIERNKIGFVGFWSRRQTWCPEEKAYLGDGEWTGIIGGKKTKITVSYSHVHKKTVLRKLEVEDLHILDRQDWAIGLREWCRESHVEEVQIGISPYRVRRVEGLYFYNGRVQTENKGIRIDALDMSTDFIKQMDSNGRFIIDVEDRDHGWQAGSIVIRLKQELKSSFHTILSLTLRQSDWNYADSSSIIPVERFSSIYDRHWCSNTPLDPASVHDVFKMQESKFKSLVLEVTKSTLEQRGIILKYKVPQETLIRTHLAVENLGDDYVDEALSLPADMTFEELMGFTDSDDELDDDEDLMEDDILLDAEWDHVANFDEMEEKHDSMISHVSKSHRLCSVYVDDILSNTNINSINKVLNTGRYYNDQRDLVMVLSQIYPSISFTVIADYRTWERRSTRLPRDFE